MAVEYAIVHSNNDTDPKVRLQELEDRINKLAKEGFKLSSSLTEVKYYGVRVLDVVIMEREVEK